jgi:hypothetical protein
MKKILIAMLAVVLAVPAFAHGFHGSRGHGVGIGIVTGVVIGGVIAHQYYHPPVIYIQPVQPLMCGVNVICPQPTLLCNNVPVYNQQQQIIGYQNVCQ